MTQKITLTTVFGVNNESILALKVSKQGLLPRIQYLLIICIKIVAFWKGWDIKNHVTSVLWSTLDS